ncbi:MAG: formate dehydrogenase-N subunit alpha [Beggiatoa sp. IS2]|nr:MAG: formate dehydrogenase-N subunit alpha [Beggiatoa sp. IS2]
MNVTRRQFLKISTTGLGSSTIAMLGFTPMQALAEVRTFKLTRTTETRNSCPYCSVGCGTIFHSFGDKAKNVKSEVVHVEGDPDHPISRGSLCPKGAGLLDFVHSPNRLKYPEYRAPGSNKWDRLSWEDAITRIAKLMKADRDANFVAKNAEGITVNRWTTTGLVGACPSSNESGYFTHKVNRTLGMLAIDNTARLCHGPSVGSLANTFGRGAMTNGWVDIKNADLILSMGGNSAEAHPCGFKWVIEAQAQRKAKLIVVDPRFNRTAAVADYYAPIRVGTDIAFLGGVINYLLTNDKIHHEYVKAYTDATFLVNDGFNFEDGLFSGYDAEKRKYDKTSWTYVKQAVSAEGSTEPANYVQSDETLQNPRCVLNLLKTHYSRYTSDMVSNITGTPKEQFLKICEMIAETAAPDKTMTILYALGWTQHTVGIQNIRASALIQMLLGNMGMAGGGINALRGHANVQGMTDVGLMANMLPSYLSLAMEAENYETYLGKRAQKIQRPGQLSYWQNYPKFFASLMKAWFGDTATKENNFCFDWLPKQDKVYDSPLMFDLMRHGKVNGYFFQGSNALGAYPNTHRISEALSKLKYLVVIDPTRTETAEFWQNYGDLNNVDPKQIQTEVFSLPSTCFAEENGSMTGSGRWVQWHWKTADPPGEAKSDREIMARIFLKLRELYQTEGGVFPEPILNLTWDYKQLQEPSAEEVAREASGKALADLTDPKDPTKVVIKAGQQLDGFAQLKDDGTTSCGMWILSGSWSEKGNLMARRDNSDPSGLGIFADWSFAWPANRRILYNRASCDPSGKPWDSKRTLIAWNGTKWVGNDVPDFKVDSPPQEGMGPFIMNPEGVGRLFTIDRLAEGPFPEHYEPMETPIDTNPLHPNVISNPAVRLLEGDLESFAKSTEFPYAATTYRLTEHFHQWTKHSVLAAIVQPEHFVEISEELAKEKGITNGDKVKVTSKRGYIKSVAMVTKRMATLTVAGKKVQTVGIILHAGFLGVAKKGHIVNTLTHSVGDANTHTPEFKAFLVNIEKA